MVDIDARSPIDGKERNVFIEHGFRRFYARRRVIGKEQRVQGVLRGSGNVDDDGIGLVLMLIIFGGENAEASLREDLHDNARFVLGIRVGTDGFSGGIDQRDCRFNGFKIPESLIRNGKDNLGRIAFGELGREFVNGGRINFGKIGAAVVRRDNTPVDRRRGIVGEVICNGAQDVGRFVTPTPRLRVLPDIFLAVRHVDDASGRFPFVYTGNIPEEVDSVFGNGVDEVVAVRREHEVRRNRGVDVDIQVFRDGVVQLVDGFQGDLLEPRFREGITEGIEVEVFPVDIPYLLGDVIVVDVRAYVAVIDDIGGPEFDDLVGFKVDGVWLVANGVRVPDETFRDDKNLLPDGADFIFVEKRIVSATAEDCRKEENGCEMSDNLIHLRAFLQIFGGQSTASIW